MRITTSKGRDFAFKLRAIRNRRSGKKVWYVGKTTSRYFWLDLNTKREFQVISLALTLRDRLKCDVHIFETNKSYWLVTRKPLERERWRKEYAYWLGNYEDSAVCHAFCRCCLRYDKATLRVSNKNGKRPVLIKVIKLKYGLDDYHPGGDKNIPRYPILSRYPPLKVKVVGEIAKLTISQKPQLGSKLGIPKFAPQSHGATIGS